VNESECDQGVYASWKVGNDLFDFFAAQSRSIGTRAQHRQAGYGIGNDPALRRSLFERGPDDLPFCGNPSLHGKNLTPRRPGRNMFCHKSFQSSLSVVRE
jgi:hypothetical protein